MLFHTVVIMVKLPSTYVCYTSVSFTVVITQWCKKKLCACCLSTFVDHFFFRSKVLPLDGSEMVGG